MRLDKKDLKGKLASGIIRLTPGKHRFKLNQKNRQVCSLCDQKSIWFNPHIERYECLNPKCSKLGARPVTVVSEQKGLPGYLRAVVIFCIVSIVGTLSYYLIYPWLYTLINVD